MPSLAGTEPDVHVERQQVVARVADAARAEGQRIIPITAVRGQSRGGKLRDGDGVDPHIAAHGDAGSTVDRENGVRILYPWPGRSRARRVAIRPVGAARGIPHTVAGLQTTT